MSNNSLTYFPKYFSNKAILGYCIAMAIIGIVFFNRAMPLYLWLFGFTSVILFFAGSNSLSKKWAKDSSKVFEKKVFWAAFLIRLAYVIFIFYFNNGRYGHYYESNIGDIGFYVPTAWQAAQIATGGLPFANETLSQTYLETSIWDIPKMWLSWNIGLSDMGYMFYLTTVYILTGGISDVILPLIIKSAIGAYTCILLYRIGKNHFGDSTGKMTAIFCLLQFNLIWWCGSMMKETEMIFISSLFIYRMDRVLNGQKINPLYIAVTIFFGLLIFTFRSALGMVAFAATIAALTFATKRQLSTGKKILAGIFIVGGMAIAMGDTIKEEINGVVEIAQDSSYQQTNMNWRTGRAHGNEFAKYAGAAVFAPLIFTIPFPTMSYTWLDQEMLMQAHGGNFEKNILSFFVILAMFSFLRRRNWREHLLPIAYTLGYLLALVLSVFAQSGRFHMPIIPFEMMFAAYGVSLMNNRNKHWFNFVVVIEVIACIGWQWFKLKGQGLI